MCVPTSLQPYVITWLFPQGHCRLRQQGLFTASAARSRASRGHNHAVPPLPCADCIFSDVSSGDQLFLVSYEASVSFVRSSFQNVDNSAIVELAPGGLVRFANSSFRNIQAPENAWVSSSYDDEWSSAGTDGDASVHVLAQPQRDVDRIVIEGPEANELEGTRCGATYFVQDDTLYDETYGLTDSDYYTGMHLNSMQTGPYLPMQHCNASLSLFENLTNI